MPSGVASTPRLRARARPSLAGSMPIRAASSSCSERRIFIIRSVPMLPEPMIAHLSPMGCPFGVGTVGRGRDGLFSDGSVRSADPEANRTQPVKLRAVVLAGRDVDRSMERAGHDELAGPQVLAEW